MIPNKYFLPVIRFVLPVAVATAAICSPLTLRGGVEVSYAWSLRNLLSSGSAGDRKETPAKSVFILLDKTASISDQKTIFKSAIDTVLDSMKAGDTLRLAEITGDSVSDFDFKVSVDLPTKPKYNMLTTNSAEYEEKLEKFKQNLAAQKEKIRKLAMVELNKKPTAMMTDLFGAIYTANLYLEKTNNRKILLILSDMVEEDNHWRFNKVHWTKKLEAKILAKQRKLSLVPDMRGTCVVVVGAKASSVDREQWIRKFWTDYFHEAKASFDNTMYSHALLHWPETESCGKK